MYKRQGNTVLVVEHDKDVISIADEIIDVGPRAGRYGGEILYQGRDVYKRQGCYRNCDDKSKCIC